MLSQEYNSQEYDTELFESLSKAFNETKISNNDAQEIFKNVEKKHMEFQRQLQASELSSEDKKRVYNL